ncbi:hypothetical protein [Nocardia seriolae]|uniref:hypothetical protein n=1 Tax=Nocardia seriolae TaxID=37332 RepID=UPI001C0DFB57|nr:hypothetical protein [Nocardia seriolae]
MVTGVFGEFPEVFGRTSISRTLPRNLAVVGYQVAIFLFDEVLKFVNMTLVVAVSSSVVFARLADLSWNMLFRTVTEPI